MSIGDNHNMKDLFNTYSVDLIIKIFKNINGKITSLISSSSEDFLFLHSNFKKVHELIAKITTNASDVINLFSDEENLKYIKKNSEILKSIKEGTKQVAENINKSVSIHNEIEKNLDYLFIPLNNYSQDLVTLKFLSANLKLNPKTVNYAGKLNATIEKIYHTFPDLLKRTKILYENIKASRSTLQSLHSNYLKSIYDSTDYISAFSDDLLNKYYTFQELKVTLQEKINRSSENSSKIITNLQYQDIVKQKIEHIEETHNIILEKLADLTIDDRNPDFFVTKAKLFLQVKDIAGLQSAQLVYANKEYQNALQIITEKYIEQVGLVEEITEMCKKTCYGFSRQDKILAPDELNEKAFSISKNLDTIDNIYKLNIDIISEKVNSFSIIYCDLKVTCNSLIESITKILDESHKNKNLASHKDVLTQAKDVSEELLKTISQIEKYSEKNLSQVCTLNDLKDKLSLIKKNKKDLVENFSSKNESVYERIETLNSVFSKSKKEIDNNYLPEDLVKSIQQVKYYELFEKEVDSIITDLDDISKKLNVEESVLDEDEKETFELLKKKYTIESEHMVHEHVSKKIKNPKSKLNKDFPISTREEKSDDVELF